MYISSSKNTEGLMGGNFKCLPDGFKIHLKVHSLTAADYSSFGF